MEIKLPILISLYTMFPNQRSSSSLYWLGQRTMTQLVRIAQEKESNMLPMSQRLLHPLPPRAVWKPACVYVSASRCPRNGKREHFIRSRPLDVCIYPEGGLDRAGHENPPCRESMRLEATHVSQRRKTEAICACALACSTTLSYLLIFYL